MPVIESDTDDYGGGGSLLYVRSAPDPHCQFPSVGDSDWCGEFSPVASKGER
jgi:hypothetical protein